MTEIPANPDIETLKLTLWIAAGVIGLLLLVVAFFLKKQISVSETLTEAVNGLTRSLAVLETHNKIQGPVIERRLNEHAERLDKHAERLAKVETSCAIRHKD